MHTDCYSPVKAPLPAKLVRGPVDLDLAIWFSEYPEPDCMLELEDNLILSVREDIGRHETDLVVLNSANAQLRLNATVTSIALYERSPGDAMTADCISFTMRADERDFRMRRTRGEPE